MTEMVPSGLMRGHWRRSDGAAYTGTKLETAETAKVHLHTTAPVLYSTRQAAASTQRPRAPVRRRPGRRCRIRAPAAFRKRRAAARDRRPAALAVGP